MKHLEKTYNKIIEEIELHFRTQKALKNLNGSEFKFWDICPIDVYDEYIYQCNLKDIEPTFEEYHILRKYIENLLIDKKYIVNWVTVEKLHVIK